MTFLRSSKYYNLQSHRMRKSMFHIQCVMTNLSFCINSGIKVKIYKSTSLKVNKNNI